MGEIPSDAIFNQAGGSVTTQKNRFKKEIIDGPMHQEDIKMNKGLLKEINDLKK